MSGKPRTIDRKLIFELRKEGLTLKEIGEIVGTQSTYVWRILNDWGMQNGLPNPTEFKQSKARIVVEEIVENGGYPKEAIKRLGLYLAADTVRRMAKKMQVKLSDYFYYKRENFNWIVNTPGTHRGDKNQLCVTANCKHCGNKQSVRTHSMDDVGGPKCKKCGKRTPYV